MRMISGPALFIISLLCAYQITNSSWGGNLYVYLGDERSPAAVRKISESSGFNRDSLLRSAEEQMLLPAELSQLGGDLRVVLGHPLLTTENGKEFACEVPGRPGRYDRVQIQFWGSGIAESGEPAIMVVEAPCSVSENLSLLKPMLLPLDEIMVSEARDQEIQIYGDAPVMISFINIPHQWPTGWVIHSIKIYQDRNPEDDLTVVANQILEMRPELLSFDWKISPLAQQTSAQ